MFPTTFAEKNQHTSFIFNTFLPENIAFSKKMWRTKVKPDRAQIKIKWRRGNI
jgi:hypothetical protein